jgi:hypothetical protein
MTITLTGRPKIEVTESCGKLDLKGEMMLWTYLNLQGKPHLLVPEPILPPSDPHPFPSPKMPVFTGHSARGLDASGMSRPTIVLNNDLSGSTIKLNPLSLSGCEPQH